MEVGVLALQGDVSEHRAALADLGVAGRAVKRGEDLNGLDGIILPGGESTTMSMLLDSAGLREPLSKEIEAGLPVFGTCAGMILLSRRVLDGRPDQRSFDAIDLSVRRNGYGRQVDSFECDLHVRGVEGEPVHAVFIRAPLVEEVGEGVEVLADIDPPARENSALAELTEVTGRPDQPGSRRRTPVVCRQGPVLVSAFHPELTRDRRLHQLFLKMVEERGR